MPILPAVIVSNIDGFRVWGGGRESCSQVVKHKVGFTGVCFGPGWVSDWILLQLISRGFRSHFGSSSLAFRGACRQIRHGERVLERTVGAMPVQVPHRVLGVSRRVAAATDALA